MKKILAIMSAVMILAGGAMGQGFGLQIGDTCTPIEFGMKTFSAGMIVGEVSDADLTYVGARGAFGMSDQLTLFAGLGQADIDITDGLSFEGGAVFGLDLMLPVDVALRGAIAIPLFDDVNGASIDVLSVVVQTVVSTDVESTPGLTAYGAVGVSYLQLDMGSLGDHSSSDLALSGGLLFSVDERFSLFAQMSIINDIFIGAGASWLLL